MNFHVMHVIQTIHWNSENEIEFRRKSRFVQFSHYFLGQSNPAIKLL